MSNLSSINIGLTKGQENFLMVLLLCISGNPLFTQGETILNRFLYPLAFFLILIVYSSKIPTKAWNKTILWCFVLSFIFIGQYIVFKYVTVLGCFNYLLKVVIGILSAYLLGSRFPMVYLKVMVAISIISFPFFFLNAVGLQFPAISLPMGRESLIIYTQSSQALLEGSQSGIPRNFGFFWEPGAFAGYLIIAFILFIDELDWLIKYKRRDVIILLVALLTTISTTGYLVLSVIVLFYILQKRKGPGTILLAIIVVGAMVFAFMRLDFLYNKILAEYTVLEYQDWDTVNLSRFGSVLFDWQYIVLHPIVGNGLADITRFSMHIGLSERLGGFGNGFTGAIHILGVPFMLIYLIAIYRNRTIEHKWIVLFLIVLLLNGEYYLDYPLFFSLIYVSYGLGNKQSKLVE